MATLHIGLLRVTAHVFGQKYVTTPTGSVFGQWLETVEPLAAVTTSARLTRVLVPGIALTATRPAAIKASSSDFESPVKRIASDRRMYPRVSVAEVDVDMANSPMT
jgi:hypothetical protein